MTATLVIFQAAEQPGGHRGAVPTVLPGSGQDEGAGGGGEQGQGVHTHLQQAAVRFPRLRRHHGRRYAGTGWELTSRQETVS